MFAGEQENVTPDICILGKALTGGYLPLALTLTTEKVFAPFLRRSGAESTLFYGHSYSGNALGAAAALASLQIFQEEKVLANLQGKIRLLESGLAALAKLPEVTETRQCGFISAVELAGDAADARAVCVAARAFGLLTRPIQNSVVLLPPFCITEEQLRQATTAIGRAIAQVFAAAPREAVSV